MSDFKGKVALVTGAGRGIGASEVRLLAAKGARVLATDILDDLGAALAKEISASGATAAYVHLDATRTADWARAVERAVEMFGQLDILINNAGVHGRLGLEETSEEEWHRVLDNDLKTAWLGMKHCIPVMRRRGGGAIVNTSSVYGLIASGKATAYHAAKGGVLMVSKAAAVRSARTTRRATDRKTFHGDRSATVDLCPIYRMSAIATDRLRRFILNREESFGYIRRSDFNRRGLRRQSLARAQRACTARNGFGSDAKSGCPQLTEAWSSAR